MNISGLFIPNNQIPLEARPPFTISDLNAETAADQGPQTNFSAKRQALPQILLEFKWDGSVWGDVGT